MAKLLVLDEDDKLTNRTSNVVYKKSLETYELWLPLFISLLFLLFWVYNTRVSD